MNKYFFDTCIFADYRRSCPRKFFPCVWNKLYDLIVGGTIVIHSKVKEELFVNDDEITQWLKSIPHLAKLLYKTNSNTIIKYNEICDWAKGQNYSDNALNILKDTNKADAFLCADSIISNYTLVTSEKRTNSLKKVPIPDICDEFDIRYINLFDFMEEQSIIFE